MYPVNTMKSNHMFAVFLKVFLENEKSDDIESLSAVELNKL